jgi:integrase
MDNGSPVLDDLRHYYASALLKEAVSIAEVSRALGDASPTKTLSVYAHVIGDAHDGIRRVLNSQTWADGQTTAS